MIPAPIFVCCTVKNRAANLKRLCASLSCMQHVAPCRLIVADFASTDGDLREVLQTLSFSATLVVLNGVPFNRSQGLNTAVKHSDALPGHILFFLDVDMLVPVNLPELLRAKVKHGQAWFPICYSLHKGKPASVHKNSKKAKLAHGWWRGSGKGMCGFIREDFTRIGMWNEALGITWGREDGAIARRTVKHGVAMVRGKCSGLFHVWHPGGAYKTRYHGKRYSRGKLVVVKPKLNIWKSDQLDHGA